MICIHLVGFNKTNIGSDNDVKLFYWNDCAGMGIDRFSLDFLFQYCPRCGTKLLGEGAIILGDLK